MDAIRTSGKELVRAWLAQRRHSPGPLPPVEEIRRQLGWLPAEMDARAHGLPHAPSSAPTEPGATVSSIGTRTTN